MKAKEGLTIAEYVVAGMRVALAIVAAFTQLGNSVGNSINAIENVIEP